MSLNVIDLGAIVHVQIDRPEADNRLDAELLTKFGELLQQFSQDPGERKVLLLTATGENFSLGRERSEGPQTLSEVREEFNRIQEINGLLTNVPLVTISALQGRTEGAGLSLSARCDIVIAADNARLSFPEIPHGIPPTIVLSYFRYKLPENLIGDLIFSGREVLGRDAVGFNLAARHVPDDSLQDEAMRLAEQVATYDADSMRLVKSFLRQTERMPFSEAPEFGVSQYVLHSFRDR